MKIRCFFLFFVLLLLLFTAALLLNFCMNVYVIIGWLSVLPGDVNNWAFRRLDRRFFSDIPVGLSSFCFGSYNFDVKDSIITSECFIFLTGSLSCSSLSSNDVWSYGFKKHRKKKRKGKHKYPKLKICLFCMP